MSLIKGTGSPIAIESGKLPGLTANIRTTASYISIRGMRSIYDGVETPTHDFEVFCIVLGDHQCTANPSQHRPRLHFSASSLPTLSSLFSSLSVRRFRMCQNCYTTFVSLSNTIPMLTRLFVPSFPPYYPTLLGSHNYTTVETKTRQGAYMSYSSQ